MKELLEIVRMRAAHPERPYALATVVRVEGSSYRKPGARMLIGARGRLAGSVSGGCLEKDVISRGLEVILSGSAQLAVYDTTDQEDLAFGTSLGCQGRIEILIEPVLPNQSWPLAELAEAILCRRRAAAVATIYRGEESGVKWTGRMLVLFPGDEWRGWGLDLATVPGLRDHLAQVLTARRARAQACAISGGKVEILLERIAPPLPLVVFGGGHDVPPLVRLARELGHRVTVVDRRVAFAEPQRFPGADQVIHARPAEVLARLPIDEGSAVVIMNHHYETDAELLGILLGTPVAYLGMLGPRKRTGKILQELRDAGLQVTEAQMEKLHAPAGLDLGSENPEQIALSILAEIQAMLAGRSAVNLRASGGGEGKPFQDVRVTV
jgi:xanthine/CO dehydrogenase XdhC/CoxF family maturation factor